MGEKTVTGAVNQDLVDATKKREKESIEMALTSDGSYVELWLRELVRRRDVR